ncbi:NAD+ synthase [Geoglobus acetivorans]|uniref:NH(3)-dependent NAD(+) synthetase n=1 Tax=Geoglobus acetivorans TaxID=565033 RepID=A0A0A7GEN7_GEOAI|nr:NAD synthetase [Geoglobus acetivorans]
MTWEKVEKRICQFIKKRVEMANADGVVVALSGGIDSSVVAYLSVRALGPEKVFGLLLPEKGVTPAEDIEDALEVCKRLGIEHRIIEINPIVDKYSEILGDSDSLAFANIKPRVRMSLIYYHANRMNRVVAGTGNKSELKTGYFTKYGDGGVDFLPIGDLYKTEIFEFAEYLGIPERIVKKKPSARLWRGQTDEGEMGISYDKLDRILKGIESGLKKEEIVEKAGVAAEDVEKVIEMVEKSRHKRELPPIAPVRALIEH